MVEPQVQDALAYADNIIATLREPFLVLDKSLFSDKSENQAAFRKLQQHGYVR